MADPLIVCPSHGRAGQVLVFKVLPDIPLCVAESQAPLYAAAYPGCDLIIHPDDVVGIAPKRQWMLDKLGDVMMFDDDVTGVSDVQVGLGESAKVTDPDRIRGLVQRLFGMAEALGATVCGFSSYADPAMYRPQNPFSLKQMVSGHTLGVRRSDKVVFPPKSDLLTDDLFISALGMFHDRVVLTDLRYAVSVAHTWHATGGMAAHRTWQRMVENEKYLKMVFGDEAIRRRQNSARSSIANELQLQLSIGW
jgi:hypothetical protein